MTKIQKIEQDIQSLKEKILNPNVKVSELLREAKIIAHELEDKEFLKWIDRELNGYSENDEVPQYRMTWVKHVAWNPFHGWVPVVGASSTKCYLRESIPELESFQSDKELICYYPEDLRKEIYKATGFNTEFALIVSPVSITRILESVRNKLLDWIIDKVHSMNIEILEDKKSPQIFPKNLIEKLPDDLKILCDDFNFNFSHNRSFPCMLILRLLLPRSIVRKFQKLNKEDEIKKPNGEYLEPEALLGKVENLIADKRVVKELRNYKFLMDAAQHSYTINIYKEDVEGAGIKIRAFLESLFENQKDEK
mgnify:CR=1 FL=1|jgi:hypothetical protein